MTHARPILGSVSHVSISTGWIRTEINVSMVLVWSNTVRIAQSMDRRSVIGAEQGLSMMLRKEYAKMSCVSLTNAKIVANLAYMPVISAQRATTLTKLNKSALI